MSETGPICCRNSGPQTFRFIYGVSFRLKSGFRCLLRALVMSACHLRYAARPTRVVDPLSEKCSSSSVARLDVQAWDQKRPLVYMRAHLASMVNYS